MRTLMLAAAIAVTPLMSATAGDAPKFFTDTYPAHALEDAMKLYGTLKNENASLDAKSRELVALGVAAQIPCTYCVYAHTRNARNAGASEAEIREAIATAAMVRHWSTVLNGMAYDMNTFTTEYDELVPSN